ncbi:MAG: response regulator [Elusimicrobiota bacterium]
MKNSMVVVEDDGEMLEQIKVFFETVGDFSVSGFTDPERALEYLKGIEGRLPDIIVADIAMPGKDGYALGREIRLDHKLSNIPLVFLSAKTTVKDKIEARRITPYYFPKDGDRSELMALVNSVMEEHMAQSGVNPLTRLPGNTVIEQAVNNAAVSGAEFVILYIDCDNFKAYNDVYGPHKGDIVIKECSGAIDRALRRACKDGFFLGHLGGDDFVAVISGLADAGGVCNEVFGEIERIKTLIYEKKELQQGFFKGKNRKGETEEFELLSVSIGVLDSRVKRVDSWSEASNVLTEVKVKAKSIKGNSYCVDSRKGKGDGSI